MEFVNAETKQTEEELFRTMHIFHFNDVYNFDPAYQTEPIGGASRFAAELTKLRQALVADECTPMVIIISTFVKIVDMSLLIGCVQW